ncbi:NUDIX domain-containing protein [Patescibacteria group bacterium]|nr:NUDIX domain-containing protein [Patescibacteria group bacterium]
MASKVSVGLLMYRYRNSRLEVFLVHPGGPFFARRVDCWGIPKGQRHDNEDLLETAKREFSEETGIVLRPENVYSELGSVTYPNGKNIFAWAFEDGSFDPAKLVSNKTKFGWPEIDKGGYFTLQEAEKIILPAQKDFLSRLLRQIDTINHS